MKVSEDQKKIKEYCGILEVKEGFRWLWQVAEDRRLQNTIGGHRKL